MNVLNSMYNNNVSLGPELNKVLDFIVIATHKSGTFYFQNSYNLNTDLGYSRVLGISESNYNEIMYCNLKTHRENVTYTYVNMKDAKEKKWLLCILLLNKYKTLEEIKKGIRSVMNSM